MKRNIHQLRYLFLLSMFMQGMVVAELYKDFSMEQTKDLPEYFSMVVINGSSKDFLNKLYIQKTLGLIDIGSIIDILYD